MKKALKNHGPNTNIFFMVIFPFTRELWYTDVIRTVNKDPALLKKFSKPIRLLIIIKVMEINITVDKMIRY